MTTTTTPVDNGSIPLPQWSRGKRAVAQLAHYSGASRVMAALHAKKHGWPWVRAINYHQTVPANAQTFESHLRYYRDRFAPVSADDLDALLARGEWKHDRPGLLISFDDGARSNYDVAAPLLDQYGFVGWFFVPAAFIDCPAAQQKQFARENQLPAALVDAPASEPRVAIAWDELRDLRRRGHVIGCHTMNHRRMSAGLTLDELQTEIVESRAMLNDRLGGDVDSFCWVGGEEGSYSASAAKVIAEAGYRFGFMTNSELITPRTNRLQLNRTNIEDRHPLSAATLLLSGLMDMRLAEYRNRVNALTAR